MMSRTCALSIALLVLLTTAANADKDARWSAESNGRSDWVPLTRNFRDSEPSASAQHEVATILTPPEPVALRQQRLAQAPRQGRGSPQGPQQYFPGDQSHLIRFPNEPPQRFKGPQQQGFPQNFQNQQPLFLPPQGVPPGFPPPGLTRPAFQPQPIPGFAAPSAPSQQQQVVRQNNSSFVPAGPQDEVQLVYVPVEALQAQKNQNNFIKNNAQIQPPKFRTPEESFQDQLRNFVKQGGPTLLPNSQKIQQEQQRLAQLNEQEERRRIQEQELKQRREQEQRIRQEQEQLKREELELRAKKENELRLRKEQEAREHELRLKQERERKEKEERARQEQIQRQQQQKQQQQQQQQKQQQQHTSQTRPQQLFAPSLQAQEQAFQQTLKSSLPNEAPESTSPAPHQPPLAVYMGNAGPKPAQIEDVLFALRDAHTIPVLDRVSNSPPQVFVGPAEMTPPTGYTKFELPYLSSLESNRVERKVEQLPFYVAPLSFQVPNGYSKIPFPAPHVGSVVVSHGNRHQRPLSPDPIVPLNEFSEELPSISPAIPLLVNSLQSGRGPKHQRTNVEQQHLIPNQHPQQQHHQQQQHIQQQPPQQHHQQQHQFIPHQPPQIFSSQEQPFVPNQPQFIPHQQPFAQQHQQQFIPPYQEYESQQQFGPQPSPQPVQFEEDHPITTLPPEPTTTTTEYTTPRRPIKIRGRVQHGNNDGTPNTPRTKPRQPYVEPTEPERKPVNRGRRPGARVRTTTPQPTFEETFDNEQQYQTEIATPAPQQYLKETSVRNEQQFTEQRVSPTFPPSQNQFSQESFQEVPLNQDNRQQNNFHQQNIQQSSPSPTDGPFNQNPKDRFPSRPTFQENVSEQAEVNFENLRPEPQKTNHGIRQQEPTRSRTRNEGVTYVPVTTSEPPFHRSRPAVIQPIVSSTPEPLLQHSPTPYVTTPAYPSESPVLTPHHISKGEVGKVQQPHTFPFIPTPLPELPAEISDYRIESSPEPSIENNQQQFYAENNGNAPEPTTIAPTDETPATQSVYQTPSRPRARPQPSEATVQAPRHRTRISGGDSSEQTSSPHHTQRFRGRGQTSREESNDESITTVAPVQRVRPRVHGRGRTTEAPTLQITVTESRRQPLAPLAGSDEASTETPGQRTRGRFRTAERVRGTSARQQVTRGRQPGRQQESESLDLVKPVRQNLGTTTEATSINESPVYVPDEQFEAGFIPSVDPQKQPQTSTTEAAEITTVRPGRVRYNNFAAGTRGSQRRPSARTTASSDDTTSTPVRVLTGRGSRRQQATAAPATRVTHVRGSRIRRPNSSATTTESPQEEEEVQHISTGVTYVKNAYVTIHRGNSEAPAAAEEARETREENSQPQEHLARQRQRIPQSNHDEYVEQPAAQYDQNAEEPVYQQYYSPSPTPNYPIERQEQQQYYTASSPSPRQLTATPSPVASQQYLREESPQPYDPEEYEYEPQPKPQRHQRIRAKNPSRFADLDDPEYGEESQRSEQISIQQLEGALASSLFNKGVEVVDVIAGEDEKNSFTKDNIETDVEKEEKLTVTTETVPTATDEIATTVSDDEVSTSTTPAPEPAPSTSKPAPHAKPSEGRRRRIRVRTRKQRPGDVFETAESQNVASVATNLLSTDKSNNKESEWKYSVPSYVPVEIVNDAVEESEVEFTTPLPSTDVTRDFETTLMMDEETTYPTSTTEASVATTTEIADTREYESTTDVPTTTDVPESSTPRVLGTSTTTEISLETEICYRGRCVKTKVDADQVPIE